MKLRTLLVGLLLAACGSTEPLVVLRSTEGHVIRIRTELARTPEEQAHGLMGRTAMEPGTGMLFLFQAERPLAFWMKNTLIPLDVLYFDEGGNYVSSVTMTPCEKDPCRTYPSSKPAKYALEVPEGLIRQYGFDDRWRMELQMPEEQ